MTDPSELIARITAQHIVEVRDRDWVRLSDFNQWLQNLRNAAAMLATLAAERDAALAQVRTLAIDALIDQNQAMSAYAKPAAPTRETVRVKLSLVRYESEGTWSITQPNMIYKNAAGGKSFEFCVAEVTGTVEPPGCPTPGACSCGGQASSPLTNLPS